MFKFAKEQKSCEIAGVKIGAGDFALIGTIFYREEKDRDNMTEAQKKMDNAIQFSKDTGIGFVPDVYLEKGDDVGKIIQFISSFELPFMVDSTEWEIRTAALKHCKEVGLGNRLIYNSINFGMAEDERDVIKELKPESVILLAFNPLDNSVNGKVNYVKNKLLPFSTVAGVKNVLVDSGVLPIGSGSLNAIKAVVALKSELGLPTGNGIHNVASDLISKHEKDVRKILDSSLIASQVLLGADFLLYGPIESAWRVFPVVKMMRDILRDG
jgi:tetrahydromethanopterin S-methyltransferase subunit H